MIKWSRRVGKHTNGEHAKLGRWVVFSTEYDGMRPKGSDNEDYRLSCFLPGIKSHLGNYSESGARVKAEAVLKHWLKGAGFSETLTKG